MSRTKAKKQDGISYASIGVRLLSVLAIAGLLMSCGGSSGHGNLSSVSPIVTICIAPTQQSVRTNQSMSLTAQLTGTSNTGVSWMVAGVMNGNAAVGTISGSGPSVTYNAPGAVPTPNTVVITATAQVDTTSSASVSLTIMPPLTGPIVSVWMTTDDRSELLQPQGSVKFSPNPGPTNVVIYVDETQVYQTVEGFGAAFTDSSAYLLNEIAVPSDRDIAMSNLFTRAGSGIGLSFMRTPIGASDFAQQMYSFDDLPQGQTDPELNNFSIIHDQRDIIPIILQAKALNSDLEVVASPWSPPGWMKTTESMIGGTLLPSMYDPFAHYLVKYLQAYEAAGIPINYLTVQNEPLGVTQIYPGMLMDPGTQIAVLRDHVLPAFTANSIRTKILIFDHDWWYAGYPGGYPDTVMSDPTLSTSDQIAGVAWHGYGGTPGVQNKFAHVGNYETEHSGGSWIADQVKTDFEEIVHVMRNDGRAYVKWNLALDENGGPLTYSHNSRCTPLVTVNSQSGAISYDIEYYTMGHFSKFVQPGASRIYSSNANGVVSVAFRNPDGSKTLVAFNDSQTTQTFSVQWGGAYSFTYTLASLSGATFTWTGQQIGTYTVNARSQIQASSFDSVSGLMTEPTQDENGGYDLGYADQGDYAIYKNIDFEKGLTRVVVRLASASAGGILEFHIDDPDGPMVSSVSIPLTGGWQSWTTVSSAVSGVKGIHDLYAVFKEAPGNINWFYFQ